MATRAFDPGVLAFLIAELKREIVALAAQTDVQIHFRDSESVFFSEAHPAEKGVVLAFMLVERRFVRGGRRHFRNFLSLDLGL